MAHNQIRRRINAQTASLFPFAFDFDFIFDFGFDFDFDFDFSFDFAFDFASGFTPLNFFFRYDVAA